MPMVITQATTPKTPSLSYLYLLPILCTNEQEQLPSNPEHQCLRKAANAVGSFVLVVIPCLSRLVRLPRQAVLVRGLLQRLVIRLPFLRIEFLLQVAGRRLVVARLHR
jgi:hypothetical protein